MFKTFRFNAAQILAFFVLIKQCDNFLQNLSEQFIKNFEDK